MVINVYRLPHVLHVTLDHFVSGDHMILSQQATNPSLRVFRNTDQKIDILVKTIDRTPVLIDDDQIINFRVYDRANHEVISVEAVLENYDKGHYSIELSKVITGSLELGNYTWAMVLVSDDLERLLYTDKDYGANAPLRVVEGPMPPQPAAIQISTESLTGGATGALKGAAQVANPLGVHSLVLGLDDYFGTVTVEATLDRDIPQLDSEWTPIKLVEYTSEFDLHHIGFVGNYTWVRVLFSDEIGLKTISYRNQ
jgi:hypothetical protein